MVASNFRAESDSFIVYPAGSELAFALDSEVQQMFKDVGSLQYPILGFYVKPKSGKGQTVAIYVVPKGEARISSK